MWFAYQTNIKHTWLLCETYVMRVWSACAAYMQRMWKHMWNLFGCETYAKHTHTQTYRHTDTQTSISSISCISCNIMHTCIHTCTHTEPYRCCVLIWFVVLSHFFDQHIVCVWILRTKESMVWTILARIHPESFEQLACTERNPKEQRKGL